MYLKLNKKRSVVSTKFQDISFDLDFKLEEKEIFFENSNFYLFLKSNYSESFINQILEKGDDLTVNNVKYAFKKDGFFILIIRETNQIVINRDISGLTSAYYYHSKDEVVISSNVHFIGNQKADKLNDLAIYQLLYFDYLWDGQTIYEDVFQFKLGANFVLDKEFNILSNTFVNPQLDINENKLTDKDNIKRLRKEIVDAHRCYLNEKNIVFLSGGIDSVAMLIVLNDLTSKDNILNHSFKVKGTDQDETDYARSIANHLDNELLIIERDLDGEINEEVFRNKIREMNNPYPGMWIFGNQINSKANVSYFAGQDTRLHTPALNSLDLLAFKLFILSKKGLAPLFYVLDILLFLPKIIFNIVLKITKIKNKYFLGLRRALYAFNTKKYIELVFFKVDKVMLKTYNLPLRHFKEIKKAYSLSLKGISNKRSLYNIIVSKKWIEQYVNDMRYMIDMVNNQSGKLAMPFYDMDLAKFSASIPFNLSVKTMEGNAQFTAERQKVNKYVLREALVDKIDQKTYLRSKAVSRTGHIFFNTNITSIFKSIINNDLESENSLVKKYGLDDFLAKFLNRKEDWEMNDDKYLLKVYYTVCLIIFNEQLETNSL